MTKGDLRHTIWGRPFKPMAVGLIIGGMTLSVNTLLLSSEVWLRSLFPVTTSSTCRR